MSKEYDIEQVEMCPYCDSENSYPGYDPEVSGYITTCSTCGRKIFLCDACLHADDNLNQTCDWHENENGHGCMRGFIKKGDANMMNFVWVWDMKESDWNKFSRSVNNSEFDEANATGEFLGSCRVGDLCFDIRAWNPGDAWCGWGFELFCGGIDSGYGYSCEEALSSGKYKDKYEVPVDLVYPYDYAGSGDFATDLCSYSFDEFKAAAESVFTNFILQQNNIYSEADLVTKANEPLRVW